MSRLARAIALLAVPGAIAAWAGPPDTVVPADDAYHLKYFPANAALAAYTEWWYFNLVDAAQNLQAVLVYVITNPDQAGSAHGAGSMMAVAYTPGGTVFTADAYPVSAFAAAYNYANVQLGGNSIRVTGLHTYQLAGASANGAMAWNLTFDGEAQPFLGLDSAQLGKQTWEKMSWLVYMPRAGVSGQLTVNGTVYSVSGSGYHDHNWGEWIAGDVLWNWAQYSQNGLWFDIYDFTGETNGTARVGLNGATYTFSKSQYQLLNTKWVYDPVNQVSYPVQTTFSANNGSQQLQLTMDVIQSVPLGGSYIIYEQTSSYTGQVVANGATVNFSGEGLKEYTVNRPRTASPLRQASGPDCHPESGARHPH